MGIIDWIFRIILIILSGTDSFQAVAEVSRESGVSFLTLWDRLPDKYK